MRLIFVILVSWMLGATVAPAFADQNDPQLDELFVKLHEAQDVGTAKEIERRIWNLWLAHPDEAIKGLMDAGQVQMRLRDYRTALKTFEMMVDLAPDFAEGWNKRATIHWLLGNYRDSLADIDKTLALEPRHFGALSGRGLVYAALEEWELALESFESALEVYPQMTGPRVNADRIRLILEEREI